MPKLSCIFHAWKIKFNRLSWVRIDSTIKEKSSQMDQMQLLISRFGKANKSSDPTFQSQGTNLNWLCLTQFSQLIDTPWCNVITGTWLAWLHTVTQRPVVCKAWFTAYHSQWTLSAWWKKVKEEFVDVKKTYKGEEKKPSLFIFPDLKSSGRNIAHITISVNA